MYIIEQRVMQSELLISAKNNKLFEGIDLQKIETPTEFGKLIVLKKGESLFEVSSLVNSIYLVFMGKIREVSSPKSSKVINKVYKDNEFIFSDTIYSGEQRDTSAVALVESYIIEFTKAELNYLIAQEPKIMDNLTGTKKTKPKRERKVQEVEAVSIPKDKQSEKVLTTKERLKALKEKEQFLLSKKKPKVETIIETKIVKDESEKEKIKDLEKIIEEKNKELEKREQELIELIRKGNELLKKEEERKEEERAEKERLKKKERELLEKEKEIMEILSRRDLITEKEKELEEVQLLTDYEIKAKQQALNQREKIVEEKERKLEEELKRSEKLSEKESKIKKELLQIKQNLVSKERKLAEREKEILNREMKVNELLKRKKDLEAREEKIKLESEIIKREWESQNKLLAEREKELKRKEEELNEALKKQKELLDRVAELEKEKIVVKEVYGSVEEAKDRIDEIDFFKEQIEEKVSESEKQVLQKQHEFEEAKELLNYEIQSKAKLIEEKEEQITKKEKGEPEETDDDFIPEVPELPGFDDPLVNAEPQYTRPFDRAIVHDYDFSLPSKQVEDKFETITHMGIAIVTVNLRTGTVTDASAFKKFMEEVINNGNINIVVDLQKTTFIDSTFLGVLIHCVKKIKKYRGKLKLVSKSETKSALFIISGMDKIFQIYDNLEEAVNSFHQEKDTY